MIDEFAAPRVGPPVEAIEWARTHWNEAGRALIDMLEAYVSGADRADRAADALFVGAMLFSEMQDTRAFAPLCRLSLDHAACDALLGDAITENLEKIVPRIWGGDLARLEAAIAEEAGEPYMRGAFLRAYCWLALTGAIEAAAAKAFLTTLPERMTPKADGFVWWAWSNAAYDVLGEEIEPAIRRAYENEWIDIAFSDIEDFELDREDALADPKETRSRRIDDYAPVVDAVAELLNWQNRSEDDSDDANYYLGDDPYDLFQPAVNPYRNVGRNDPCPCGSGKKFKKCCLPKVEQGAFPR
jgi:hypothetical protein